MAPLATKLKDNSFNITRGYRCNTHPPCFPYTWLHLSFPLDRELCSSYNYSPAVIKLILPRVCGKVTLLKSSVTTTMDVSRVWVKHNSKENQLSRKNMLPSSHWFKATVEKEKATYTLHACFLVWVATKNFFGQIPKNSPQTFKFLQIGPWVIKGEITI